MAGHGESASRERFSGGEWVERRMRIPTDRYSELRPLLGWLVTTYGVEIDALTPGEVTEERAVVYNERKVIWMDNPNGVGRRPVIPFERLRDQETTRQRQRAGRLVNAIDDEVRRAYWAGRQIDLTAFVRFRGGPDEEFDIQGLYADRAMELAHGGVILERITRVGPACIKLLQDFCADLVQPAEPTES